MLRRLLHNWVLLGLGILLLSYGLSRLAINLAQAQRATRPDVIAQAEETAYAETAFAEAAFAVETAPGKPAPQVLESTSLEQVQPVLEFPEADTPITETFDAQAYLAPLDHDLVLTPSPPPDSPVSEPEEPLRLVIPVIDLDAPILPVPARLAIIEERYVRIWRAPREYAAGWQEYSARLGETGNTVLNGHHNAYGEVFKRLVDLQAGDVIQVYSQNSLFQYRITNKMVLDELYQPLEIRMQNAQWILPSTDERLTLVTCWPYESNTHRLIIVAEPVSRQDLNDD